MKKSAAAWCLVSTALLLAAAVLEAANCSPVELSPCLGAITGGQEPSSDCCGKLKEQESCLCGYIKNPVFAPYINSPNAKKVAATCGVTMPACS